MEITRTERCPEYKASPYHCYGWCNLSDNVCLRDSVPKQECDYYNDFIKAVTEEK